MFCVRRKIKASFLIVGFQACPVSNFESAMTCNIPSLLSSHVNFFISSASMLRMFLLDGNNSLMSPLNSMLGLPVFPTFSSSSFIFSRKEYSDVFAGAPQPNGESSKGDYEVVSTSSDEDSDEPAHPQCLEYAFRDLQIFMDILQTQKFNASQAKPKLDQCGIMPTPDLVAEVLSQVRNNWEAALTFFLWAGKQPGYAHRVRQYHSMISILGKMRRFDTAWSLVDDMRGCKTGPSLVTPQTLLIMIRKYSAVHDVAKAINTFYAHKRFGFEIGMKEFQDLLSALCRYKNVKDAEHLLFCNKNIFPLNTKSINIILSGWCNVLGDLKQGERIWKEMKLRGISHDVFSYASIMSCYSRVGNLSAVLKLYSQMTALGIEPDRKVYNAVIHSLAKARHVQEARNLMKIMEDRGISATSVTYNSLIMPICWTFKCNDAREVFNEMLERGISPTIRTFHAFFRILSSGEEVFGLLERMKIIGCHPTQDTYRMLIRKFCRWQQLDSVFKLWSDMTKSGLDHDRSSYIVLIHGLFLNGNLEESYKYYAEMKGKHLVPDPKIDEMLQSWFASKQETGSYTTESKEEEGLQSLQEKQQRVKSKRDDWGGDILRKPEMRKVKRERGFSFLGR